MVIIIGIVCALGLISLVELIRRKHSFDALHRLYKDLEMQTKELTKTNELLFEEIKNARIKIRDAQNQLIQAEKFKCIGELTSSIAHEVRNPLAIILQGVNFLEDEMPAAEGKISETLIMLKDGVKRADKIINNLLEFSRVTSLNLQTEDVNSILESSLTLVKAESRLENIDIVMETKKDIPRILADRTRLEQVFINILLNAVQAMPEGGRIVIRSYDKKLDKIQDGVGRRVQDNFKLGERAVVVEIEDTGVGISEENIKRAFEPFFSTKGTHGIGLGLYVSKNLINLHQGLIYVESKLGKGTKISVALKIA